MVSATVSENFLAELIGCSVPPRLGCCFLWFWLEIMEKRRPTKNGTAKMSNYCAGRKKKKVKDVEEMYENSSVFFLVFDIALEFLL